MSWVGTIQYKFFFHFFLSFNYSCPHFPPLLSPALPTPTCHIQSSHPSPVVLVHGGHVLWFDPSPSFPHYPLPFLSSHCQFFRNLVCFNNHWRSGTLIGSLEYTGLSIKKVLIRSDILLWRKFCNRGEDNMWWEQDKWLTSILSRSSSARLSSQCSLGCYSL